MTYLAYFKSLQTSKAPSDIFKHRDKRPTLDKSKLPQPAAYLRANGIRYKHSGQWLTAICQNPQHSDSNPSMRIHAVDGYFRCFSCGCHGGDLINLHELRTGLGFIDAAKALGAINDD